MQRVFIWNVVAKRNDYETVPPYRCQVAAATLEKAVERTCRWLRKLGNKNPVPLEASRVSDTQLLVEKD